MEYYIVIAAIVAMPAIIAILFTILGGIWLRSSILAWKFFLYSLLGSLLGAIVGCLIGSFGEHWYVGAWSGVDLGLAVLWYMILGWVIGAIVGGVSGAIIFLYCLGMRR